MHSENSNIFVVSSAEGDGFPADAGEVVVVVELARCEDDERDDVVVLVVVDFALVPVFATPGEAEFARQADRKRATATSTTAPVVLQHRFATVTPSLLTLCFSCTMQLFVL
jgi:hypothetical protein